MRVVLLTTVAVMFAFLGWAAPAANADIVTFTGTVSYSGPYSGDTLYVGLIDTSSVDTTDFVVIEAYAVGSPPFDQSYSLSFDNTNAPTDVIVAALLDVDGGGPDTLSGADILGWYPSTPEPVGVSTATSHGGLHFDLPEAEIHGNVLFAPGQLYAFVIAAQSCTEGGFGRPPIEMNASGDYVIKGVYAGTWCVFGFGFVPPFTFVAACFGDATCENPTPVTLTETEVKTGIDLDFTGNVPAPNTTWGRLKNQFK